MTDPLGELKYPGESRLVPEVTLLPVSPQRLLATWAGALGSPGHNGNGRRKRNGRRRYSGRESNGHYCLRVREVSGVDILEDRCNRQWVYELGEGQTGCMIDLDRPGLTVCAELIRSSRANGKRPLARSRRVRMPLCEAPPSDGRIRWMICEQQGQYP